MAPSPCRGSPGAISHYYGEQVRESTPFTKGKQIVAARDASGSQCSPEGSRPQPHSPPRLSVDFHSLR